MILKDILDYFAIEAVLPDYLLNQTFNEVFLDGEFTVEDFLTSVSSFTLEASFLL